MTITEISKIFKGPLDKLFALIGDELKHSFSNRILEYQEEEYKRNFLSKTILHRSAPKPLNEFYEPLYILEPSKSKRIPTDSAKKLFSNRNYITLIGNAGSGKSTIIKYLFTNCFEEKFKIPIKIELRYLNEFDGRFNDYIFNEIFHFQKLGFTDKIIDRMLSSDAFIFLLDGYDEISSKIKEKTTKDIDSFVTKYPNIKYILTSRPYTHIESLPLFENYEVSKLQGEEIASFVKRQIPQQEVELANKIIEAINRSENESYKEYLNNPLLLSMFILTFQSYSDIPQKRSDFYAQVFETLFAMHDSESKLSFVREKTSGLSKDQFEEVLQLFSFLSFFEEKFIFSSNYLNDKLNLIKSKKSSLNFDNLKFIDDLQVAIGILNKEGLDYTFPHRSLQEYFAATYIFKLDDTDKKTVYEKIILSIADEIYHNRSSRDHFCLLLSELDKNKVIEFAILPFINDYDFLNSIDKVDDHDIFFDKLGEIQKLYSAFNYIMKSDEQLTFAKKLDNEFNLRLKIINRNKDTFELKDSDIRKLMSDVAKDMIKPFLKQFIPKMKDAGSQLTEYLKQEKNSDAEIIGMIK